MEETIDELEILEDMEVPVEEKPKKKTRKKVEKEAQLKDIPGVGPGAIAKLDAAGIYDLMGVASMTPALLNAASGMSEAVSRKAIQAAREMLDMGFVTGLEQEKGEEDLYHISFGSKNLDNLLGGKGIRTKSITEVYGGFGSSKTQLAIQLAVRAQLPEEKGGANGKVVYIDSEVAFRPDRVRQFAEGAGIDPEDALNSIFVARALNSDHQMLLLDKVAELIKNGEPIRLMIIDSFMTHFRSEYQARGKLADRQQKLNRYLHDIQKLADAKNIAVFITNQVMSDPAAMFGDPTRPTGGHVLGHASAYRIYLRKGAKDSRIAKLVDAPNLPDDATAFMVETSGFKDIEV